jgi:hypothetical protein
MTWGEPKGAIDTLFIAFLNSGILIKIRAILPSSVIHNNVSIHSLTSAFYLSRMPCARTHRYYCRVLLDANSDLPANSDRQSSSPSHLFSLMRLRVQLRASDGARCVQDAALTEFSLSPRNVKLNCLPPKDRKRNKSARAIQRRSNKE